MIAKAILQEIKQDQESERLMDLLKKTSNANDEAEGWADDADASVPLADFEDVVEKVNIAVGPISDIVKELDSLSKQMSRFATKNDIETLTVEIRSYRLHDMQLVNELIKRSSQ